MILEVFHPSDSEAFTAPPGGSLRVDFRLTNDSSRPALAFPRLVGVPPGWVAKPLDGFRIEPGESIDRCIEVVVGDREPRGCTRVGMTIETGQGHHSPAAAFDIDIQPTDNVDVRVEPSVAVGGSGHFTVLVRNEGSRRLSLDLSGVEITRECTVAMSPPFLELLAGESDSVEMLVRGGRHLVGGFNPRPILVTAVDSTGERWRTDAYLRQSPTIPRWLIIALICLVCFAVWLSIVMSLIVFVRDEPIDQFDQTTGIVGTEHTINVLAFSA